MAKEKKKCQMETIIEYVKDFAHAEENGLSLDDFWTRMSWLCKQHKCNFKK